VIWSGIDRRIGTALGLAALGLPWTAACHSEPTQTPPAQLPDGRPSDAGPETTPLSSAPNGGNAATSTNAGHAGPGNAPDTPNRPDTSSAATAGGTADRGTAGSSATQDAGQLDGAAGQTCAACAADATGAAGVAGRAGHAGSSGAIAGSGGQTGGPVPAADDDGEAGSSGVGGGGLGGGGGHAGGAGRRWLPNFCVPPATCLPIDTLPFSLATCCPDNGEQCGYQVTRPVEQSDGTCKPTSEIFLEQEGYDEQRVTAEDGPDQLLTPDCETRTLLAFPLVGCCMPNNRCGVSTYQVTEILAGLALVPAPFTRTECVSVEELNAQFHATTLAGFGQIPPSNGTCNYADLDARLKAPE